MSNVQFEDQQQFRSVSQPKGLEGMVIKMGLAKDRKGAQVLLLIIAVLAVVIGFMTPVIFGSDRGPGAQPSIQEELLIQESLNDVPR